MFSVPDPAEHPGRDIARMRAERGISDEDLRQKSVAFLRVRKIEAGQSDIPFDDARFVGNLAAALRCEPRYLLSLQKAHDKHLARELKDVDAATAAAVIAHRKQEREKAERLEEQRAQRHIRHGSRAYVRREFRS